MQLDVPNPAPIQNTFVVVVYRNGEDFLGAVLPNHVINERRFDFGRFGNHQRHGRGRTRRSSILGHGNDAALNALLTDQKYRGRMAEAAGALLGTCDEILGRLLTFAAE